MNRSTTRLFVSLAVLTMLNGGSLSAQDQCSSLLTHGIYDYFREQGESSSLSEIRHDVCSAYQRYQQAKTAGAVDVSYKVFAAGASFSAEQIDSIGQQMCDLDYKFATASSLQSKASALISPAAVQAWQSCVSQFNFGLRVSTDISPDASAIDLSVYFVPLPGTTTFPSVTNVIVTPGGAMNCAGTLKDAADADAALSGAAMQLTCSRQVSPAALIQAGNKYWALPVSLAIHTTAGNIVRHLAGVPVPPDPASPNVGDVVASLIAEAQFVALHGPGWVLADGRDVAGTKYATLVGSSVPDLRAMFLRGSNAGRSDAFADKQGDRMAGTYQSYSTAPPAKAFTTGEAGSHNHGGRFVGNGAGQHQTGPHGGPAYDSQPIVADGSHTHVIGGGDAETRPNNAAVFYYVRVE